MSRGYVGTHSPLSPSRLNQATRIAVAARPAIDQLAGANFGPSRACPLLLSARRCTLTIAPGNNAFGQIWSAQIAQCWLAGWPASRPAAKQWELVCTHLFSGLEINFEHSLSRCQPPFASLSLLPFSLRKAQCTPLGLAPICLMIFEYKCRAQCSRCFFLWRSRSQVALESQRALDCKSHLFGRANCTIPFSCSQSH